MEKIIIADSSLMFAMALEEQLSSEVSVRRCHSANELLVILQTDVPALLVLDLSLPGCDGIELLRTVTALPKPPAVLAMANYVSDFLKGSLAGMGIGYLMLKPCGIEKAANRVREMLAFYAENPVPRDLLYVLGISEKLTGASYIRYALPLLMENPYLQLTKELYPMIAAKFGKNAQSIERSIRNAVHTAWKKNGNHQWQAYLGKDQNGCCKRPSNSEFFHMLLKMIEKVG